MTNSYLHNAKGRGIVASPVIVCIKIFLISFMRWQFLWPAPKEPKRSKGDRPPCNPRRASTRTPKTAEAFFGGVAVSAIISPLPRQKAPPRQGHTERNCRLNTEIVCSAGFAVAFGYKQMLVCGRAGVRVAVASAVICLTVAKSTAAARVYGT